MAIRIPKRCLDAELRKKIASDLWIQEIHTQQGDPRTVRCFEANETDVFLPHDYALNLFPEDGKRDLFRRELDPLNDLQFKGRLLEEENRDQRTVATEAWTCLMSRGCVLLNAFPGFGKTMLFTALSCRLRKKTLVLCAQDRLLDQAMETYRECSNARICKLSTISGREIEKDVWDRTDVFFSTEKSCYKLNDYLSDIGTLVIDECHEFCSSTRIGAMLMTRPRFLICCSASLQWKKDGLERAMWNFIGEENSVVRRLGKKFFVFRYNCMNNISIPILRGKLDYAGYMKLLHEDTKLMEDLMTMLQLNCSEHKTLILVKNIEFVDRIRDEIIRRNIHDSPSVLRGTIGIYKDSKILIGTFSKIGTGFDPKSKGWDGVHFDLLMLVDSTRTTGLLEQLYGRVFRSSLPIVVNWVYNNPISKGHFTAHNEWYRTYTNAEYLDLFKPLNIIEAIKDIEKKEEEMNVAVKPIRIKPRK